MIKLPAIFDGTALIPHLQVRAAVLHPLRRNQNQFLAGQRQVLFPEGR